jgi:hypothetical protein
MPDTRRAIRRDAPLDDLDAFFRVAREICDVCASN